ncbi:MAG: hypothetical protein AAB249_03790, partial [Acidobacteriota bacterium]
VFPRAAAIPSRRLYYIFLGCGSALTAITLPLGEPGALILLTAVIGFVGTVVYTWALVYLDRTLLPRLAPDLAPAGSASRNLLVLSGAAYTLLAILYLAALLR